MEYIKKYTDKLVGKITPAKLFEGLLIIHLLCIIPMLWIGIYDYPSADDYSVGSNCRQAFMNTHSVFAVFGAGVARAVNDWLHWMGYYTCNLLTAMPPHVFGERAYMVTPFIMIGALNFSTAYLLKTIFRKVFHADRYLTGSAIVVMLFVTTQCMVGRAEAFYWYSGAANYIFVHSICLCFFGLLISAGCDGRGKKRKIKVILASVLGFFAGGGNQMSALNNVIVLTIAVIILSIQKKWKENKDLWIPMLICYVGFVLNIAAPGNLVRASAAYGMNPVKAIFASFYYFFDYCVNQWSGWPVILMVLMLIPLFYCMAGRTEFTFPCPLLVAGLGVCLVAAMMTPPLFALGNVEAKRVQALTYAMYILVVTLCTGYGAGWLRRKTEKLSETDEKQGKELKFSKTVQYYVATCMIAGVFAAVVTIIPVPRYFTFSSAITDLANGSAKAYGEARKERITIYESGEKDVVVKELPAQPELLYFSDIKEDPEDWENRGLCRFYGIDSVRKIKETE